LAVGSAVVALGDSLLGSHSVFFVRAPLAAALRAAGFRGFDGVAAGRRLGVAPSGSQPPGPLSLLLALIEAKLSKAQRPTRSATLSRGDG
jgi:hypothetical protein